MKYLISRKPISDYEFNNELAGMYIFALQCVHSGLDIDDNILRVLKSNGLHDGNKIRVFNFTNKAKRVKTIADPNNAYNKDTFIQGMVGSGNKLNKIIGLYLLLTETYMPTLAIAEGVVARHRKDASNLLPWMESDESKALLRDTMVAVSKHAKENDYTFNLNTIYKRLTS